MTIFEDITILWPFASQNETYFHITCFCSWERYQHVHIYWTRFGYGFLVMEMHRRIIFVRFLGCSAEVTKGSDLGREEGRTVVGNGVYPLRWWCCGNFSCRYWFGHSYWCWRTTPKGRHETSAIDTSPGITIAKGESGKRRKWNHQGGFIFFRLTTFLCSN